MPDYTGRSVDSLPVTELRRRATERVNADDDMGATLASEAQKELKRRDTVLQAFVAQLEYPNGVPTPPLNQRIAERLNKRFDTFLLPGDNLVVDIIAEFDKKENHG